MSHKIKRLPVHPAPSSEESLSSWIESLAMANKTPFRIILKYITQLARNDSIFKVLNELTGFSIEQISRLNNDLRINFWKEPNQCPFQNCDYKTKEAGSLKKHLAYIHDVRVKWHQCSRCDYKTKQKNQLKKHLANIHDVGVKWHQCPRCDYKTKTNKALKRHLAYIHDVGAKWHQCPRCDHKTKNKYSLKRHLAHIHEHDVE